MTRIPHAAALVLLIGFLAGCTSIPTPAVTVTQPPVTVTVPGPTVTVTAEAEAVDPVRLTDGQRATLDTTFGRSLGADSPLVKLYCPMDDGGRRYYAELIARQIDTLTTDLVMEYLREVC